MTIGPFTFRIPQHKMVSLIVARRTAQREYKIILSGQVIGSLALWFIALASGFDSGWVLGAVIFTALMVSFPLSARYWARRIATTMEGVATAQTWLFDAKGVTVTNEKGQVITSPWSVVTRISHDQDYGYLEDHTGGKSPLPLAIIGSEAMAGIERLRAESLLCQPDHSRS